MSYNLSNYKKEIANDLQWTAQIIFFDLFSTTHKATALHFAKWNFNYQTKRQAQTQNA